MSIKVDFIDDFSQGIHQLQDQILAYSSMPLGDLSALEAQYVALKQMYKDSNSKYSVEKVNNLMLLLFELERTGERLNMLKEAKPMLQAKKEDILRGFPTDSQNKGTIKRSILKMASIQVPSTRTGTPCSTPMPDVEFPRNDSGLLYQTPPSSREGTPPMHPLDVFAPRLSVLSPETRNVIYDTPSTELDRETSY